MLRQLTASVLSGLGEEPKQSIILFECFLVIAVIELNVEFFETFSALSIKALFSKVIVEAFLYL